MGPSLCRTCSIAVLVVAALLSPAAGGELLAQDRLLTGGIAALVGEKPITYAELGRGMASWEALLKQRYPDRPLDPALRPGIEREILERIIARTLILQEAEKLEIQITEANITEEVNRDIEQHRQHRQWGENIRDAEEFYRLLLENENITREEYREEKRKEMAESVVLWRRVFTQSTPRPGELREYYTQNLSRYQTPSELTFRMILVPFSDTADRVLAAVDEGLRTGVDFAALARRYSSSNAEQGGLWKKKFDELKAWHYPLPRELRAMKEGEIRGVQPRIATDVGWIYLKIESITPGETRSFEDAQAEIVKELTILRRQEERREFVAELRRRTPVQIFLPDPTPRDPVADAEDPRGARDGEGE
jgi:parvulin-like peptidyl-prolyl isomerase